MLAKQKKEEGEANVTTVLFDDEIEVIHDRFPINVVKPLTDEDYYVRGCTALLDAVGSTVKKVENIQILFFLLAFPHVCLNYRLFGVAVPDARYAAIWQNLTGKLPTLPDFITAAAVLSAAVCGAAFIASWALKRIKARHIFSALGVVFAVSVIYTALSLKSSSEEIYDYINSFFEGF